MSNPPSVNPTSVNVAVIRDELRKMWASEALAHEGVIRASTHNLIVFVSDQATAAETTERIVELTAERPGRVIVVDVEPGESEQVEAWVSTYCRMVGKRQICGELITLAVRGELRQEMHGTIAALLVPDLPVYLWWTGALDVKDHLFLELCDVVDRVLVDTAECTREIGGLVELAELSSALHLSDLNWARLTPWRRALAALWDAPELRHPLNHIRALDVHYVAGGDLQNSERGLLLVGWLAHQLGWSLKEARVGPTGGRVTTWRKGQWEGKLEMVETRNPSVPAGEIAGIYIQAGAHPPYAMPHLTAMPEAGCIEVHVAEGARTMHRYEPVSTASALAEELDLGYDPGYRNALHTAAEIVKLSRS
jgi:glucose-6-phosphate dehydrogenase assembly protein OpcA